MKKIPLYSQTQKFVATKLLFGFLVQSCQTTLNGLNMDPVAETKTVVPTKKCVNNTMLTQHTDTVPPMESEVLQRLQSTNIDNHAKLDIVIKYLIQDRMPQEYVESSKRIIPKLSDIFQGEESHKLWVRYFDVTHKIADEYKNEESLDIIRKGVTELVQKILLKNNAQIDWRIAKKMLAVKEIFHNVTFSVNHKEFFRTIITEIDKAFEYMLWKNPKEPNNELTLDTLSKFKAQINDPSKADLLSKAIITGRFDKKDFGFTDTAIMGEDGGMYLLLNNHDAYKEKVITTPNTVTSEYLNSKIKPKGLKNQITIGKGGFGTVRFALSLLDNDKTKPAGIICVKKTKNFEKLKSGNPNVNPLESITNGTLGDYFTNDVAEMIQAPNVFDMSLVTDTTINSLHQKGYLMMEVLPQNTGTAVFKKPEYQKWEYQKPYLLDVLRGTVELLSQNIAHTNLKTDNTLYNPDIRKATIIDLGGTVKVQNQQEISNFDVEKYPFEATPGFFAPELNENSGITILDMNKALAYTCGRVIKSVITACPPNKQLKLELKNEDISTDLDKDGVDKIKRLITLLTKDNPEERISIKDAIKEIEAIGDDSYKKNVIFTHYTRQIKERIANNKSSISINEDIESTQDLLIKLDVTSLNPYRYKDLKTEDLFEKIDKFFATNSNQDVMLLLGAAGSGKSIALQIKFIEAIKNWKPGMPVPIYFNLANNIDLEKIILSLNKDLGTNLTIENLQNAHLYIDSFDEGLGIVTQRDTLIKSYIAKLGNPKILISCRQDYLPSENDYTWFTPESKKLDTCYVAPINYTKHKNLDEYVTKYVDYNKLPNNPKYYLDKIQTLNLKDRINTGFMFHLVMQSIDSVTKESASKQGIYKAYVDNYQHTAIKKLTTAQQEIVAKKLDIFQKESKKAENLEKAVSNSGKFIATQLHLQNVVRITHESDLFKAMGYNETLLFKEQTLYHILKLLPLKIETKHSSSKIKMEQAVEIGFIHDTIKNYFLLEAIKDEFEKTEISTTLAAKNIIKDVELIKFIAATIPYDEALEKSLRKAIDLTKTDKFELAVTAAANAITLLVAAQCSFYGEDLSNVSIRGANIRNAIFQYTDFTGADLTNVDLSRCNLVGAKFVKANMKGVDLSVFPDLVGHEGDVNEVTFSPDGTMIASAGSECVKNQ